MPLAPTGTSTRPVRVQVSCLQRSNQTHVSSGRDWMEDRGTSEGIEKYLRIQYHRILVTPLRVNLLLVKDTKTGILSSVHYLFCWSIYQ